MMKSELQKCLHIKSETDREVFLPFNFEILTAGGWMKVSDLPGRLTYARIVGTYNEVRAITEIRRVNDRTFTLTASEYWQPGDLTCQPRIYTEICGKDIERRRGCIEIIESNNLPLVIPSVTSDGYLVRPSTLP